MNKRWVILMIFGCLAITLTACSGSSSVVVEEKEVATSPSEDDQGQTVAQEINAAGIFAERCANCHGADRSGSRGPALLPERLDKDQAVYAATITNGSGSMPAWGSRLSAEEINALVEFILSPPQ